jgi:hypothetical protein
MDPTARIVYGPLTSENVHVDVYGVRLPIALAGIASVHVGVNVWLPMPVLAAALNSFVAVGAVPAAGSVYG